MNLTEVLAQEFGLKVEYSQNIINLLDEGCTIPFIARYRKEMHGTCDDQTLRAFADRLKYLRNLNEEKAKVEKTIKSYLQKYSDTIKLITEESAKTSNIQGAVAKDKLEERKSEVQQIRTNIENSVNTLIEMSSEETIKKEIEKEGLSAKYVDLYNELMIGNLSKTLAKEKETMSNTKDKIMELFDKLIATYDYLLEHKDSWDLENNQILFTNSTHLREYNKLVQELQTKARLLSLTR